MPGYFPSSTTDDPADDLRALMQKHGLMQQDVARLASVSIKTVESWLAPKTSSMHRRLHPRILSLIRHMLPAFLSAKKSKAP